MRKALWIGCLFCFGILSFFCAAQAEEPSIVDITMRCKFYLPTKASREAFLFDCDANTYWEAEKGGAQYIQLYKPVGSATLSLLWAKIPKRVEIVRRIHGEDKLLDAYEQAEVSPPLSIPLPEEAGFYRLLVPDGDMAVAELRIHEGALEDFFLIHGYPPSPTHGNAKASYEKPLKRNARVSQRIRWMQQHLIELGYYDGRIDGILGEKTYLALLAFQRANGLYASGVYEPATAHVLESGQAIATPGQIASNAVMPRTASAFIAFLQARLGAGYVAGGMGQTASPSVRAAAARLYPEFADLLKNDAVRWDGMQAFDCSGLIKAFLEESKGAFPNEWKVNVNGATRVWMLRIAPIATMPRQPGVLLLQAHPTIPDSFIHMGVYVGNGQSIHSRGHRYGVVMDPMPQLWTHWALPIWLKMDMPLEEDTPWPEYMAPGTWAMVDSSTGGAIILYSQPMKSAKYRTGIRIPNYTELFIESVPEGAPYWRGTTVLDAKGQPVTGYVYARDLSLIP